MVRTLRDVSILTLPEDRVRLRRVEDGVDFLPLAVTGFNPHPARRQSATQGPHGGAARRRVSILTLPEDRVRPTGCWDFQGTRMKFQSSPCPKTECDIPRWSGRSGSRRFNPHPARRQSATGGHSPVYSVVVVSILTLPEDRVRHEIMSPAPRKTLVSILTLPEDRVRLAIPEPTWRWRASFNPHPARRQSATPRLRTASDALAVSILTLPEDRVRPWSCATATPCRSQFQSSPCPKTECDRSASASTSCGRRFQSSPCPKTECDATDSARVTIPFSFQSSPCPKTECDTGFGTGTWSWSVGFNPHPARRQSATNCARSAGRSGRWFQSSPCPKTECDSPRGSRSCTCHGCFNPHPARRQSATVIAARR